MNNTAYPPTAQWPGPDRSNQPSINNTKGYDVQAVRLSGDRRAAAYGRANGTLNDNQYMWPVFVHDIRIDLALSGTTAQSQLTRDFYPHHFVMPSFTIQGQALDQEDYGYLCEYIHQSQRFALQNGHLTQLWIKGLGFSGARGSRQGVHLNGKFSPNQMIRGPHQQILCQGYVGTMPRQHRQGMISPTYSFQFMVAHMLDGLYKEATSDVPTPTDWHALLQNMSFLKINHKLEWNNWWVQNWAKNNSQNIFNTNNSGT